MTATPHQMAVNLFEQSEIARKRGDKGMTRQLLQASVRADGDLPGAWYNLASIDQTEKNHVRAVAELRRALESKPGDPHILTNLGWSLQYLGRFHEAAEVLVKAIDANPDLPLAWSMISASYASMHALEHAIAAARKAVELSPKDPQHHMALAFALLMDGQWAEGFREYEWRVPYKNMDFANYPMPKWDGKPVDTLFVPMEQGFGDVLQFGRFLYMAAERAKKVIVCVQEELSLLLELGADISEDRVSFVRAPAPLPEADAFCPFMSLPVALGLTDEEIPATANRWFFGDVVTGYRLPSTTRRKIGIVWAGSSEQDNDHHRSATVDDFLTLYEAENVQLYSLQVGDRAREARPHGPLIIDLSNKIRDFADTAALMLQMDAIVTVCTSAAHLAGSLGLPVHIVLPRHGQHFVWGYGSSTTPWYPSARLYRQEVIGNWLAPLKAVVEGLNGRN